MFRDCEQTWKHLLFDPEECSFHESREARTEEYHALLFRKVVSIGELLDEHQHCNLCVIDLVRLLCEELHDVEDQEDGFVLGQIVFTDFKQGLDALILHLVIACH